MYFCRMQIEDVSQNLMQTSMLMTEIILLDVEDLNDKITR